MRFEWDELKNRQHLYKHEMGKFHRSTKKPVTLLLDSDGYASKPTAAVTRPKRIGFCDKP